MSAGMDTIYRAVCFDSGWEEDCHFASEARERADKHNATWHSGDPS